MCTGKCVESFSLIFWNSTKKRFFSITSHRRSHCPRGRLATEVGLASNLRQRFGWARSKHSKDWRMIHWLNGETHLQRGLTQCFVVHTHWQGVLAHYLTGCWCRLHFALQDLQQCGFQCELAQSGAWDRFPCPPHLLLLSLH